MEDVFAALTAEEKRNLVRDMLAKKNGDLDLDWIELVTKYELNVSSDTLRKAAVGLKLADDVDMVSEPVNSSLADSAYMDRVKMRDLISQLNAHQRSEARSEALRETICEVAKGMPPIQLPEKISQPERISGTSIVVGIGDLHFGAEYEVKGICGETLNKVTPEIIVDRLWTLASEIVRVIDEHSPRSVHLCFVGDLIDGMLRQSQLMRLRYGVVESVIKLAEVLAAWIGYISTHTDELYVHYVSGNHSEIRPLGSNKGDFEEENLERIIWWYVNARIGDSDHVILFDEECDKMHCVDICDRRFLLLHGDNPKDISTLSRDAISLYGTPIDYFLCGHLHKEAEYLGGSTPDGNSVVVRVPSLCGADPYATRKFYGGKPGATIMVMKTGRGRYCVYPVMIDPMTKQLTD